MNAGEKIVEIRINNLFKDVEYIIPIYQRNYSWQEKQIRELIDDILDIDENDSSLYYLGTLIVDRKSDGKFEVIDGQQRLTTLFLLQKFLNKENTLSHELQFEARDESNYTLKSIGNDTGKKTFKTTNKNEILNGYAIINGYFANFTDAEKEKFLKKLEKVVLLRVQIPEHNDLNHYFEIMNTRGEQLELHEIVKNKFIEALNNDNEDDRDYLTAAVAIIWDACSNMDRYVQMNFSPDVREIIFSNDWNRFNLKNFDEIVSGIKNKNAEKNSTNNNLFERVNINEILNGNALEDTTASEKNDEEADKKGYESIITFPQFLLHVNLLINQETENDEIEKKLDDKQLIEHLKPHYSNAEKSKNFIFNMLKYRYYFDKYIIKRDYTNNKDGQWSLKELKQYSDKKSKKAQPVNYGDNDANKLLTMLEACLRITYTSPKTMYWIKEILGNIDGEENLQKYIDILEKYCNSKLNQIKASNSNENPFGTGFNIPRIVFTYLDYILYRDNRNIYKDFEFKYRTSIEHFYPQNPENAPKMDKEYLDNFGNLALITVSGNSRVSNFIPAAKKAEWKNDIIEQSLKLKIMADMISDNEGWDENKIKKHGEEMTRILENAII